ncbi:MAG: hypothetical protein M3347_06115 [Armatimonadota bacterium]|nr:hypothetical protein [Armatimonadota bacterium]
MEISEELLNEVRALVDEQRARCAWFWRTDFVPSNAEEARRALQAIARRGDRAAYVRAAELLRQLP